MTGPQKIEDLTKLDKLQSKKGMLVELDGSEGKRFLEAKRVLGYYTLYPILLCFSLTQWRYTHGVVFSPPLAALR